MAEGLNFIASIFCIIVFGLLSGASAQNQCVSCSYNYAGDGTTNRDCVSNPSNKSNVPCNFAISICRVRTVYQQTVLNEIQSLTRDCVINKDLVEGCDNHAIRTCTSLCRTDLCNHQNGDLYKEGNSAGNSVFLRYSQVGLLFSMYTLAIKWIAYGFF